MTATREDIFEKVRGVLIEALGVDEEEVTPEAKLQEDLGAESIDYLDISFQLEKAFNIKIPRGEMFPEDITTNTEYVKDGTFTPAGVARLKELMPHADLTEFEKSPQVDRMADLFTVQSLVKYVERKLGAA